MLHLRLLQEETTRELENAMIAWHDTYPPRETVHRRAILSRWTEAIVRHEWELEEFLFDALWPGIFEA